MAKDWWFKFEYHKWRNNTELRRCSLETKGFWLECICVMREMGTDRITGTYAEIARMVGCFPEEAARCIIELQRTKTAPVTLCNDHVTLVSRYISKEIKAKKQSKLRVQKHRRNAHVTVPVTDRVISKSKSKEIREEEDPLTPTPETPNNGGKVQNGKPVTLPTSVESEILVWLDAIAPLTGARDRRTMANPKRWRDAVEKALKEGQDLTDFLAVIKSEAARNKSTPQYFTPEACLKTLQLGQIKANNGFIH